MNEYTYKAKKLEDGEWTQGSLFAGVNNHLIIQNINMKDGTFIGNVVDKDTICRRSANGLWEHDVIMRGDGVGVVRYGVYEGCYGFYVDWQNEFIPSEEDEIMLVGNVIDRPNLVEEVLECLKEEE